MNGRHRRETNNPNKNDRKDPKTIMGLVNEGRFSYQIQRNVHSIGSFF